MSPPPLDIPPEAKAEQINKKLEILKSDFMFSPITWLVEARALKIVKQFTKNAAISCLLIIHLIINKNITMNIFGYNDYKKYLHDLIEKSVRGQKATLAEAAGCQRSFFSQVLTSSVHLTLEHAMGIAKYLRLTSQETDYFYYLIGHGRAGTPTLREFYWEKMNLLKQKNENLSERLKSQTFSSLELTEYYSHWKFAAIHIACTIPSMRTPQTLCKKLKLEISEVEQILKKLKSWGLIEDKRGEWVATTKTIHLPKSHFMTLVNHKNWRLKNLDQLETTLEAGLSYSAVYSLSREDLESLKEMTIQFLSQSRKMVESSKEEQLVSFTLDCVPFS